LQFLRKHHRYEQVEILASHDDAVIFSARDKLKKRQVVIKFIVWKERAFVEQFMLKKFKKKRNIVQLIGQLKIVPEPFYNALVLEKYQTASSKLMPIKNKNELRFVMKGILKVMINPIWYYTDSQYFHIIPLHICRQLQRCIPGRDIKPSNILINLRQGEITKVALGDFGKATYQSPNKIHSEFCGTIYYAAPEVLEGYKAIYASDIWSTAVTFYELATGRDFIAGTEKNEIMYEIKLKLSTEERKQDYLSRYFDGQEYELFSFLFHIDPEKRPSANEALEHNYFKDDL
jgi:serine/threonine protein kinase